jgi:demethylmenaquinone methyltransferase/2-methoxy-6-polyprenyl-1,4-benzoquinol methylase
VSTTVTPYNTTADSKKQQVATMFNNIAGRYDAMNQLLSLGIHKLWRKKTINLLRSKKPKLILDVATGTADFAIEAIKINPEKVTGVDISTEMMKVGREKIAKLNLQTKIELLQGDSENLQFADNSFDAVTVGFGVRNFENLDAGIKNINRVLKPGGIIAVLEFSKPEIFPVKQLYQFYFKYICPLMGKLFSKDSRAYSYLHDSVDAFPYGKKFEEVLSRNGFTEIKTQKLSFGIASIYTATK